ncbi:hypothetical protein HDU84_005279 [Entophlyctis sp. JEL0112]|nr:hypothetical protein HDU84_005279 [Entophlyctis sp. JEL0112]
MSETARYRPCWWLPSGTLQTLYAAVISKVPEIRGDYARQVFDLPDGGIVAVDWAPKNYAILPKSTPIVIILHGLAGNSRETYICDLIPYLRRHGYKVAILNFRGCGEMEITTPQLYSGAWTNDVRWIVDHIAEEFPLAPLVGIGFSLGANILVKAIGEDGPNCKLKACVSVSNPYDLNLGLSVLHSTHIGIFEKSKSSGGNICPQTVKSSKDLLQFDEAITRRVFGFRSASEYYRMGSCSQFIADIRIPTLMLSDTTDPVATARAIPVDDILANPYVVLATTERGGHIGWFEGNFAPKRWCSQPVAEFLKSMIDAYESLPMETKHDFVRQAQFKNGRDLDTVKHPIPFHPHSSPAIRVNSRGKVTVNVATSTEADISKTSTRWHLFDKESDFGD